MAVGRGGALGVSGAELAETDPEIAHSALAELERLTMSA
jgi:uncharacterized protein GlcG (DUF336 family)